MERILLRCFVCDEVSEDCKIVAADVLCPTCRQDIQAAIEDVLILSPQGGIANEKKYVGCW